MMEENFRVIYEVKIVDRNSRSYGYIKEKKQFFPSFQSAVAFARLRSGEKTSQYEVLGKPVVEKIA